jgi:hypothetical protein
MFCARVVIHSTWRSHSGGACDVALGGGARSAPRKEEYVTSMDFRMVKSPARLSAEVCFGLRSEADRLRADNNHVPAAASSGYS